MRSTMVFALLMSIFFISTNASASSNALVETHVVTSSYSSNVVVSNPLRWFKYVRKKIVELAEGHEKQAVWLNQVNSFEEIAKTNPYAGMVGLLELTHKITYGYRDGRKMIKGISAFQSVRFKVMKAFNILKNELRENRDTI